VSSVLLAFLNVIFMSDIENKIDRIRYFRPKPNEEVFYKTECAWQVVDICQFAGHTFGCDNCHLYDTSDEAKAVADEMNRISLKIAEEYKDKTPHLRQITSDDWYIEKLKEIVYGKTDN